MHNRPLEQRGRKTATRRWELPPRSSMHCQLATSPSAAHVEKRVNRANVGPLYQALRIPPVRSTLRLNAAGQFSR